VALVGRQVSAEEQMAVEHIDTLADVVGISLDGFDLGDTEGHELPVVSRQVSTASSISLGDIFGDDPSHADWASLEQHVRPTAATLPEPSSACHMQGRSSYLGMRMPPVPPCPSSSHARELSTDVHPNLVRLSRPISIEQPPAVVLPRNRQAPPATAQLPRPIAIGDPSASEFTAVPGHPVRGSDREFVLSEKQRQLHAAWPAKKKRRVRPGWHFVYGNKSTTAKKRKRANGKFETVELRRQRLGGDW
jgi:hypothetical protein